MKSLKELFILSFCLLAACTNSNSGGSPTTNAAAVTGSIVEISDAVTGKFTGTAMIGGQTSQFASATVSKQGATVTISFSGGRPPLAAGIPSLANLKFSASVQQGVYDSVEQEGSLKGIQLSEYKTNLNVDNVSANGVNYIFTGVKCAVVPESPLCTCELDPGNAMCQ
jgi:hypothetical protein